MSKNRGNSQRIQHRRGSAAEWTVNNPILFAGELGYETDTTRIKIGDGVTQWVNLAYVGQFGASDLDGLTDVSITSPASGAVLRYDGNSWTDYVLSKSDVGLSNVDNTSDANKPVSTAQAAADAAVASAASSDATTKANAAQAFSIQRANHTGTQPASTITGLAAVATSGSYNDLSNRPTIPSAYTLPAATTTTLGGVIVGAGLGVASGTVSVTYGTVSGTACQGNDARLSDARVPTSHTHTVSQVTDAGTIATQNANSVAITGGSINGTTIGATTASTGRFTTVEAAGADAAILVGTGSYGRFQLSGGNATGFLFGSFAALGDGVHLAYNYYANAAGTAVITNALGPTSRVTVGYGFVAFATSSANNTAPTERVRIDGSGNVGIGTANPAARLDVRTNAANDGILLASSTSNLQIRALNGQGANNGIVQANDSGIIYTGGTVNTGAFVIAPWNNATCGLRMDSNGNVGIGTASPAQRLHLYHFTADCVATVQGRSTSLGGSGRAAVQLDVDGHGGFAIQTDATSGTRLLRVISNGGYGSGNVDCMAVTSAGNVGIGTTSPTARLDVSGQSAFSDYSFIAGLRLKGTDGINTIYQSNANTNLYVTANGGSIGLGQVNSTPHLLVASSGNVGIGTATPTISSGTGLHLSGSTLRLGTARTPASSTATGNQGEICWDSSFLYVCIATNTWRRIALTTW